MTAPCLNSCCRLPKCSCDNSAIHLLRNRLLTSAHSAARTYFSVSLLLVCSWSSCHPGEWKQEKSARCKWKDEFLACSAKVSCPGSSNSLETEGINTSAHSSYQLFDNSSRYLLEAQKRSATASFSFWFAEDIPTQGLCPCIRIKHEQLSKSQTGGFALYTELITTPAVS